MLFRDVGDFDTPAEHFSEFPACRISVSCRGSPLGVIIGWLRCRPRRAPPAACAADGPAQVYVLGSIALAALPAELKLELALLSMRYMSHRLDHVANRIWETRCVSI